MQLLASPGLASTLVLSGIKSHARSSGEEQPESAAQISGIESTRPRLAGGSLVRGDRRVRARRQRCVGGRAGQLALVQRTTQYVRLGTATPNPGGVGDKLNASVFTLEVWFNRTNSTGGTTTTTSATGGGGLFDAIPLIAKGRGEGEYSNVDFNYFFGIDQVSDRLAVDFEDSTTVTPNPNNHSFIGSTAITPNVWHHAAVTYDGQTWRLYLDGRLDATQTLSQPFAPRADSIQRTAIGSALTSTGAAGGFFNGGIDEARVWNVARTWEQIRDTKDDELTSGAGLVGRWGLDEGTPATTVADSTASPITGTLVNTPTWVAGQYAFPQDTTPPSPPAGVSAVGSNANVALNWTANSEADLVGYNVYRGTSPGVSTSGTPLNGDTPLSTTSYSDSSVTNGTTYYYAVTAVDTANNKAATEGSATPSATLTGLIFDGSDDHVAFGPATSTLGATVFTLETWFKRTGPGTPMGTGTNGLPDNSALPLVTKGRGQGETPANLNMNYFLGLDAATNKLVADFEDTANGGNHPALAATGILVASPGTWHHAAATYASGIWTLYLDGQLDRAVNVGNFTPEATSIQHAALGSALTSTGAPGTAPGFFRGVLDEARIWSVARSGAQIQASMSQELTTGTGLLGRWGLNDGAGTTADNSVASAPDGTLTGGPTWVVGYPFTAANSAPVLDPVGDKTAETGSELAFTATASDPDAGDTLTFSLANGTSGSVPAGASITSGGAFTWTPSAAQVGSHTFDVCVSDGELSDCETIDVAVAGLVGDWKADEGSGITLVNSSGIGATNNGTLLGNPTWVAGQHGQAIRFDGTGDYATVADNASLDISGAITLATWVKPEKTRHPVPDQEGHPGRHRRL